MYLQPPGFVLSRSALMLKLHGSILRPSIKYGGRKINSICTDGTRNVPLKVDRYDKTDIQN